MLDRTGRDISFYSTLASTLSFSTIVSTLVLPAEHASLLLTAGIHRTTLSLTGHSLVYAALPYLFDTLVLGICAQWAPPRCQILQYIVHLPRYIGPRGDIHIPATRACGSTIQLCMIGSETCTKKLYEQISTLHSYLYLLTTCYYCYATSCYVVPYYYWQPPKHVSEKGTG